MDLGLFKEFNSLHHRQSVLIFPQSQSSSLFNRNVSLFSTPLITANKGSSISYKIISYDSKKLKDNSSVFHYTEEKQYELKGPESRQMKDLFRGYYALDDDDFKELWEKGLFIFDTNVLLDLYRYPETAREDFFNVMKKLADTNRIWVPFHVGLEYQRNRLSVISEQQQKYDVAKNQLDKPLSDLKNFNEKELKKRHSTDLDSIIQQIEQIKEDFSKQLSDLAEKSIKISSPDPIRKELDEILKQKIGEKPQNQNEIDMIEKEGEKRYKSQIPPGFHDNEKSKSKETGFTYDGIIYQKKYGDLIIWKEIIKHAKNSNLKDIIFISNDSKPDWIWRVDQYTIHARPELVDEIFREANVERFHIYPAERFLEYAKEHLDADVKSETLEEIREVSIEDKLSKRQASQIFISRSTYNKLILDWLNKKYRNSLVIVNHVSDYPDFISNQGDLKLGFELKIFNNENILSQIYFEKILTQAHSQIQNNNFHEITIIFLTSNTYLLDETVIFFKKIMYSYMYDVNVYFGSIQINEMSIENIEFEISHQFYLGI